jgi:hypothetical protein
MYREEAWMPRDYLGSEQAEVRATGSIRKQCDLNGLKGISGVNEWCVWLKKEGKQRLLSGLYSLSLERDGAREKETPAFVLEKRRNLLI